MNTIKPPRRAPESPASRGHVQNDPPLAFRIRHLGDRRQEAALPGPRRFRRGGDLRAALRPARLPRPGKFRAPRSPGQPRRLSLVLPGPCPRYNLKWNFFDSHSDDDLERQFAADRVWGRPTSPFGEPATAAPQPHAEGRAWQRFGFDDPMELLGDKATLNPGARTARRQRRLPPTERRALDILEPRTARPRPRSASSTRRWSRTSTPT